MDALIIEPTSQKPAVDFNPEGKLKLSGKSYSYDSVAFFEKLKKWVKEYISSPADKTTVVCAMEYLNSSSQKQLAQLIFMLNKICEKGKRLEIVWKYEEGDDDILFVGELIDQELKVPFTYRKFTA